MFQEIPIKCDERNTGGADYGATESPAEAVSRVAPQYLGLGRGPRSREARPGPGGVSREFQFLVSGQA